MGQRKRDDTKAGATSAKVVPLWPASSRDHLPTGYLEQVARRVRANLTDLVATADSYNLDLAAEFRIAAELLQKPSDTSHPLQLAESTGLRLNNGDRRLLGAGRPERHCARADRGDRWEAGLGSNLVVSARSARRRRRSATSTTRWSGCRGS